MPKQTPTNKAGLTAQTYDIFCRVIDNYGDIATCWRLAQHLQHHHHKQVRLYVDDLTALHALLPTTDCQQANQRIQQIDIIHWQDHTHYTQAAQVVIEAFACDLPPTYRQLMLAQHCLCINLEYFSCEDWVQGCHALASLQHDGLRKYFFFPSILPATGGVIFEPDYQQRQQAFTDTQQQLWCQQWQLPLPRNNSLRISLFAYENNAINSLLTTLAAGEQPIDAYLPIGKLNNALATEWQIPLSAGESIKLGQLHLHIIPFLPQSQFDALLWLCDINFVRGEESLIRALLTGKPFVWHIYPTDDDAHWQKLAAFQQAYQMPNSLVQLHHDWNAQTNISNWSQVIADLDKLNQHAQQQTAQLISMGSLTERLIRFVETQ